MYLLFSPDNGGLVEMIGMRFDLIWWKVHCIIAVIYEFFFLSFTQCCFASGDRSVGVGTPVTAAVGLTGGAASPVHLRKKNVFSKHLLIGSKREDGQHGFVSSGCFWWWWEDEVGHRTHNFTHNFSGLLWKYIQITVLWRNK